MNKFIELVEQINQRHPPKNLKRQPGFEKLLITAIQCGDNTMLTGLIEKFPVVPILQTEHRYFVQAVLHNQFDMARQLRSYLPKRKSVWDDITNDYFSSLLKDSQIQHQPVSFFTNHFSVFGKLNIDAKNDDVANVFLLGLMNRIVYNKRDTAQFAEFVLAIPNFKSKMERLSFREMERIHDRVVEPLYDFEVRKNLLKIVDFYGQYGLTLNHVDPDGSSFVHQLMRNCLPKKNQDQLFPEERKLLICSFDAVERMVKYGMVVTNTNKQNQTFLDVLFDTTTQENYQRYFSRNKKFLPKLNHEYWEQLRLNTVLNDGEPSGKRTRKI